MLYHDGFGQSLAWFHPREFGARHQGLLGIERLYLPRTSLLLLLLGTVDMYAQSTCANAHRAPGAFICSPNQSLHSRGLWVPELFHFSAQGNALSGRKIEFYVVSLDGKALYQSRLAAPMERLSIELNLRSTTLSGTHTLSIAISGAGTAEVEGLQFQPLAAPRFCESVSTLPSTVCIPSKSRSPIEWSPADPHPSGTSTSASLGYSAYASLYLHNLENLEADTADAVAVDLNSNL